MADQAYFPEHFNNSDDVLDIFADLDLRPNLQSTVIAAEYDNDFFSQENANKTYMVNALTDDAILSNWRSVSEVIKTGKVSPATILQILELAVNAKSVEEDTRLLQWVPRHDTLLIGSGDLSSVRLMTGKMASTIAKQSITDEDYTKTFKGDDKEEDSQDEDSEKIVDSQQIEIRAAGYLCLCMMRLMKKDPSMFLKGITSIKRGFSQFYETASVTVLDFEFTPTAVYAIADGLRSNIRLGQTMVYHVATGMSKLNRLSQSYHLMRFTFCQHVELMGLHAYKLFYELDNLFSSKLPTKVFLSWLTNDTTIKAVKTINEIIRKYDNEHTSTEYLWLYARYLNNGYFYDLHTSRCRFLVCVLAYLADSQIKKERENQAGSMDLMELRKMSKADKESAIEYAKEFEEQYSKIAATSHIMNRIQRGVQKRKGLSTGAAPTKRTRDDGNDAAAMDIETMRRAEAEKRKKSQHDDRNNGNSSIFNVHNANRDEVAQLNKKSRTETNSDMDATDTEDSNDGVPPPIVV